MRNIFSIFSGAQFFGILAQLFNAAPMIIIPIYLAWAVGLNFVADFIILTGVASVIFTIGLFGLRHRLVLDELTTYSLPHYVFLRIIAAILMSLGIASAGIWVGASWALVSAITLLRVGDLVLDLILALDQVRNVGVGRLKNYTIGNAVKFCIVCLFAGVSHFLPAIDIYQALSFGAIIYVIYSVWLLIRQHPDAQLRKNSSSSAISLARVSMIFMIASVICSALTILPRISLKWVQDVNLAGAEGAALSLGTFAGMAFYATWLRWAPQLTLQKITRSAVISFITENLILMLMGLLGVMVIGAWSMAVIYNVPIETYGSDMTNTLAWCVVFFATMNLANLFKPSVLPWLESLTYIFGFGSAISAHLFFNTDIRAWHFLAMSIPGMLIVLSSGGLYLGLKVNKI